MKKINGILYYTCGDVAEVCNKSIQTIQNWDKYGDQLEIEGLERLIPKPIRGENYGDNAGKRYWTKEQAMQIISFSKNLKRGDLARFNKGKWGKRGEEIEKRKVERRLSENEYENRKQKNMYKYLKELAKNGEVKEEW